MSNEIKGAEIFDEGTWNGLKFNSADLDDIAATFDVLKLAGKVPLKFGHRGKDARHDDTQPALGWVQCVYRKGTKLVADVTDIPTEVYNAIKKGLYKFVSVELLQNVPAGTRKIPWVLDAVALLGATAPAVGTLKDLQALTYAHDTGLRFDAVVEFSREDSSFTTSERHHMSEDTNAIRELSERLEKLTLENARLKEDNRELTTYKAKFSQLEGRFNDLGERVETEKRERHRAQIVAAFESAIKADEITPQARERFMKTYRVADDEAVMQIDLKDVAEFIRENPNPKPKKVPRRTSFSLASPDADVPVGTLPDSEVLMRAKAGLAARGKHEFTADELQREAMKVVAEMPELGERYKYLPDELAARGNR
jgi:hypothetical protein